MKVAIQDTPLRKKYPKTVELPPLPPEHATGVPLHLQASLGYLGQFWAILGQASWSSNVSDQGDKLWGGRIISHDRQLSRGPKIKGKCP